MNAYHDREWAVPAHSDRKHFEFLVLEGAQAGLSWSTILARRAGYRRAFANFDFETVARFGDGDVRRLLTDERIIRNRLKIASAIQNAKAFLELRREFGTFDRYVWRFVKGKTKVNRPRVLADIAATSPESDALSKDLRSRGFSFVGSTIVYAHMQATGLVDDHLVSCFRKAELAVLRGR
jgi:DNA-3-methyladenine glycosylase I